MSKTAVHDVFWTEGLSGICSFPTDSRVVSFSQRLIASGTGVGAISSPAHVISNASVGSVIC